MKRSWKRGAIALALALLAACNEEAATLDAGTLGADIPSIESTNSAAAADEADALRPALDAKAYRELIDKLSEPNGEFFSDNYISNETSYLQVARQLAARQLDSSNEPGVYIGVGPEQNFSYIALTRPTMAYIVDIRRDNLVLHLLYKAAFDIAVDRAHFLALLTGRPYESDKPLDADASIDDVLARVDAAAPSDDSFAAAQRALRDRVEKDYGIELDATDRGSFDTAHRAFFADGLDIRFKLKEQSFRKYPSLRELLLAKDQHGEQLGFMVTDDGFRFVQKMQRENRIVPLVGDFAGDRALPALAKHLGERGDNVDYFYVSNVEQYLMADGVWWKWQRNIKALPIDEHSAFIRCYLDQGERHPKQLAGHRTATTLHAMAAFSEREKGYRSFHALASDGILE